MTTLWQRITGQARTKEMEARILETKDQAERTEAAATVLENLLKQLHDRPPVDQS